jgi:hypothetical protein
MAKSGNTSRRCSHQLRDSTEAVIVALHPDQDRASLQVGIHQCQKVTEIGSVHSVSGLVSRRSRARRAPARTNAPGTWPGDLGWGRRARRKAIRHVPGRWSGAAWQRPRRETLRLLGSLAEPDAQMNKVAASNLPAFCAIWDPAKLARCGFHAVAQQGSPRAAQSGHTAAKTTRIARRNARARSSQWPRTGEGRRAASPHEKDRRQSRLKRKLARKDPH